MTLDQDLMEIEPILRSTDGTFQFTHPSFQEILTAKQFADEINPGRLSIKDAYDQFWSYEEDAELWGLPKDREWRALLPSWKNVLLCMASMLNDDKTQELVDVVSECYSKTKKIMNKKDFNPFFDDLLFSCKLLGQMNPNVNPYEISDHITEIICDDDEGLFMDRRRKAIRAIGDSRNNYLGGRLDAFLSKVKQGKVSFCLNDIKEFIESCGKFDVENVHEWLLSTLGSYDQTLKEIKKKYPKDCDKPITAINGGVTMLLPGGTFSPIRLESDEGNKYREQYQTHVTILKTISDSLARCSVGYKRIYDKLKSVSNDETKTSLLYVLLIKDRESATAEVNAFLEEADPAIGGYGRLKSLFEGKPIQDSGGSIPLEGLREFLKEKKDYIQEHDKKPKIKECDINNIDLSVLEQEGDKRLELIEIITTRDIDVPQKYYQVIFPRNHRDSFYEERIKYLSRRTGPQLREALIDGLDSDDIQETIVKYGRTMHAIRGLGILREANTAERAVKSWLVYHNDFLHLKNDVGDFYVEGQNYLIYDYLDKIDKKIGLPLIRRVVRESLSPLAYYFGIKYLEDFHKGIKPQGYNPPVKKLLT